MPGDNLKIKVRLRKPTYLDKGQRFALRESGKTIGHGLVTEVLPDDAIEENVGRKYKLEKGKAK